MSRGVRVLTSRDLAPNVTFLDIIGAVEEAYRSLGTGEVANVPRAQLRLDGLHTFLNATPALSPDLGGCVFAYTGGNKGMGVPQKLAVLFDPTDGGITCLIESDWLSWVRTGASSAVATRYLARPEASVVGIFGAGRQARSQLLAIANVRSIERAYVFSPRFERCRQYAAEMSERCSFPVEPVDDGAVIMEVADIVCTATTSAVPVFDGTTVRPGTHINAIGQHHPERRELDSEVVRRSRTVVDDRDSALMDYGELLIAMREGRITADHVQASLGELVCGAAQGRTLPTEITLFLSGGIGAEYLAAANAAWRIAEERGMGIKIDLTPGESL